MRGTLQQYGETADDAGIIPAYAGNTRRFVPSSSTYRDHPRVCGEHKLKSGSDDQWKGSSPRMRGTPDCDFGAEQHLGIIPAYAGNTIQRTVNGMLPWDHPRVCGEHLSSVRP